MGSEPGRSARAPGLHEGSLTAQNPLAPISRKTAGVQLAQQDPLLSGAPGRVLGPHAIPGGGGACSSHGSSDAPHPV